MEWSEGGGKWDNCNSIINKYILKKEIFVTILQIPSIEYKEEEEEGEEGEEDDDTKRTSVNTNK